MDIIKAEFKKIDKSLLSKFGELDAPDWDLVENIFDKYQGIILKIYDMVDKQSIKNVSHDKGWLAGYKTGAYHIKKEIEQNIINIIQDKSK